MSTYKVSDYINEKFNDITRDLPVIKAYNLGISVGLLECYKDFKRRYGIEEADSAFKESLSGEDEFNTIFRTLVGLFNEETNSKTENVISRIDELKKPGVAMTDDDRDLIEEFLRFLHNKNQ